MNEPTKESKEVRPMDVLCATLTSISVIVLVLLQAPTVAYMVVGSICGANALRRARQN